MALIPKFHTAVAMFPVDPTDVANINSGAATDLSAGIYAGQVVGLTSAGFIKHATANNASPTILPIGVAGDTLGVTAGKTAYQDSLVINPGGVRKGTQNRVSDYFNDTLGSGLLSVYIVGGEFYTDMFVNSESASFVPGVRVFANATAAYTSTNAGFLSVTSTNASAVGVCTSTVAQLSSGVPGVDSGQVGDYSMPLRSQNGNGFVSFIMAL